MIRSSLLRCALGALILNAFPVHAAPPDDSKLPALGARVALGDHRLHLYCTGQGGPTVVLDAGLGGTSLDWQRVQPQVARFTRVCSYDRPGYGWSERGPFAPRTTDWLVAQLDLLLSRGGVEPPYVLTGHSFGGLIAQLYAMRHPLRTAGLVLVDSTHAGQFERFAAAGLARPLVPRGNRQFVIGNHYRIPDALPEHLKHVARALALAPDSVRTLYSELRQLQPNALLVQQLGLRLPPVPLQVLAHDSLARARDPRARRLAEIWLALQRELAASVPGGRLRIVPDSGHYIQLEQPGPVIEAVREVVETARNRS
ncbi:MAG: alpha/beta hydrolase [Candidatus Competibacterales bacterium]|nr:alpha/beta hydrolase [Candidatus Competibacterales bacterium]